MTVLIIVSVLLYANFPYCWLKTIKKQAGISCVFYMHKGGTAKKKATKYKAPEMSQNEKVTVTFDLQNLISSPSSL